MHIAPPPVDPSEPDLLMVAADMDCLMAPLASGVRGAAKIRDFTAMETHLMTMARYAREAAARMEETAERIRDSDAYRAEMALRRAEGGTT